MDDDAHRSGGESVPALRRAVRILDLVCTTETEPSAADLARAIGIPKSTAHGLLSAMVDLGLLARSNEGAFRLGPHPMRWANGFLARQDIVAEFQRHFMEKADRAEHTVTLTVLDGREVVYLGCHNSDKPLGFTFRIGMRLPAVFTATGKAQLEAWPDPQLERLLEQGWPKPMTRASVRSLTELRTEFAEIRERGYSIDNGQIREGMICLGAAIRDHSGKPIGGVAISLMESEALPDVLGRLGTELRQSADAISRRLGADPG
ncbi:IclR family transcriptional regulator [Methylobacterium brachythecii]|uniref:IclR family transcriptional regulator n=1 Tax=Methylobacterium brachythecii TaxID=1176177 RepID=A0A7W6AI02_9HYPH|nr:IclR family transcriptional regulator [Methylobacterium brachythecii]MBB3903702.1 DNA-binding IclR family transcriptional regulator [Methylobacterium brachythecii]GLS44272.1 IclR family transcriptional regulator [Methylobacterium brachythecii]